MTSSITHLRIFGLSLLLAVTLLPARASAQGRPSIAALESRIATLESNNVPNLAGYLTMDVSTPSRPTLRVAGANLQVVNGLGTTATVNGLGNVIVGYDESSATLAAVCSLGQYHVQIECTTGGGLWAVSHKSGSHNIVVGTFNRYSRYGGLIAGYGNTGNGNYASVSGGNSNTASGNYASISGGLASYAWGDNASVSGGTANFATGAQSSVSGGLNNTALNVYASVSGGRNNYAQGLYSSVSGGLANQANGVYSSVSGGNTMTAANLYDWIGGTLHSP